MKHAEIANALCATCRLFGQRGWCRATSGNFSARVEDDRFLITQSGREKSELEPEDLMLCDLHGVAIETDQKPSAETPLHALLYGLDEQIGAVLHTHSVASTVLSRRAVANLSITGFEMQKAFAGVVSHEETISIPVFDNDQDMDALAVRVGESWRDSAFRVPGFLIRGHGLYAWGADIATARRHVEGFEFLLECQLHESATPVA